MPIVCSVRPYIKCKLVRRGYVNNGNASNAEYLFLEILDCGRKLLFGTRNWHRPSKNIYIKPMIDELSNLALDYSDVILTGDFNSNILMDKGLMMDMGAIGLGHFTSSSALLDLFFIDNRSRVLLCHQLSASVFSRHDLIFMSYDFKTSSKERKITF